MTDHFERGLTITLALAAVTMAALMVRREFRAAPSAAAPAPAARLIDHWPNLVENGIPVGEQVGEVVLVEFTDFECPYCRRFDSVLRAFQAARPGVVSQRLIHFPIIGHRFAIPAAKAAECAAASGQLTPMHDLLFGKQDSLGLKNWISYAVDAGVRDTAAFAACLQTAHATDRIEAGRRLGDGLGVRATPTVVAGGWLLGRPPRDSSEIADVVDALRKGIKPVFRTDGAPP